MSFTVSQILAAARRNPELVTSETAAYMVLSLAEQSLSGPRQVCADHVLLHPGGAITIGDVPACAGADNDALLRALLHQLLSCTAQATVSDALHAVVAGYGHGPAAVRAELQTALVPLNRGAARRALARLYRKLGSAGLAEAAASPVEPDAGERGIARRSKRRGPAATEDIPVAVDETAFRVASRAVVERQHERQDARQDRHHGEPASVAPRTEVRAVGWYPAQTTPWQFRDQGGAAEGTPILGSLLVKQREPSDFAGAAEPPMAAASVHRGLASGAASTSGDVSGAHYSAAQSNPNALGERGAADYAPTSDVPPSSPDEWSDTFVDAPVAAVGDPTDVVAAFAPRRSTVAELVQRMPASLRGEARLDAARRNLLDLVNASSDEPEFFGLGTATPPPVAHESVVDAPLPPPRGPRRIVLSTLAAALAGFGAWVLIAPRATDVSVTATAAAPNACQAQVVVEAPKVARVFLNDAKERDVQSGPLARFDAVACAGQAEVTVQMPSPAGSPMPDAWVRMPLPEAELRAAAESGQALVLTPLGHAR